MIFDKIVTFPYPILSEKINDYLDNTFYINLNIFDKQDVYEFKYDIDIGSSFILDLIRNEEASLWIVFQTKDNYFQQVKQLSGSLMISKKDISLNSKSSIQAIIKAEKNISFANNEDLNSFYLDFKDDLIIEENQLLGYSEPQRYDGDLRKPLQVFEKKVDESIDSEIKIEIQEDVILIVYQKGAYQFKTFPEQSNLNNMYVYVGLSRALERFIEEYGENNEVDFYEFSIHEIIGELNIKLYNLMQNRAIEYLNKENIDYVISQITDGLVDKYVSSIGRLYKE